MVKVWQNLFPARSAEAVNVVIIHHADCLHEGIADGGSDELESAPLKVFTHRVGFGGARRQLSQRAPFVHAGFASDELPDVAIERTKLFLDAKERFRVFDRRGNFEFVADNSSVGKELFHLALVITRDALRIKPIERAAIVVPLVEDGVPAQSGLGAFQNQKLEEGAVVVHGHTPFLIVVADR